PPLGTAYVQWPQYDLLDATTQFQNDALGWSFFQLEAEHLRLRNELQQALAEERSDVGADTQPAPGRPKPAARPLGGQERSDVGADTQPAPGRPKPAARPLGGQERSDVGADTTQRLRLRYDIFVSRLGLVDHERAARIMSG